MGEGEPGAQRGVPRRAGRTGGARWLAVFPDGGKKRQLRPVHRNNVTKRPAERQLLLDYDKHIPVG